MFDWQCLRIRIWAMNSRNSLAFIIIVKIILENWMKENIPMYVVFSIL